MQLPVMPLRDPVRLTRGRRIALYSIGTGLWLTGALWVLYHYFMVQQTAFGPSPHPLEHWWLSLHGLFAFGTLWMLGLLWGAHIVGGWRSGRRRVTGSLLLLVMAELTVTGYLLYYPPSDDAVPTIALLHWTIGLATPLPFIVHRFLRTCARNHRRIQ